MSKRVLLGIGLASLGLAVSACSSSSPSSSTSDSASPSVSSQTASLVPEATEPSNDLTTPPVPVTTATPAGDGSFTVDNVTVSVSPDGEPTITVAPGTTPPSQLVVADLKTGTGPALTSNGFGLFNYVGVLYGDGSTFDSSWERGQPIPFGLNQNIILGWQQGLTGMQEGGQRLLIIPPDLAYGTRARQGIPPNSTLVFVVDLEKVEKP